LTGQLRFPPFKPTVIKKANQARMVKFPARRTEWENGRHHRLRAGGFGRGERALARRLSGFDLRTAKSTPAGHESDSRLSAEQAGGSR